MATKPPEAPLLPLPPLLITDYDEEFNQIRNSALYEETKPVGIIEEMYVDEIADLVWQILRLKRCKTGVILGVSSASAEILGHFMDAGPAVARDWISNPTSPSRWRKGSPPTNSMGP